MENTDKMANDRAERLKRKKTFVINKEHAEMILDLLDGDFEVLGKIFVDLVAFNLYGDTSLLENADEASKPERMARKLLASDAEHYIQSWLGKSEQNTRNRTARNYPDKVEFLAYCREKGFSEQDIHDYCEPYFMEKVKTSWLDQNGEPIKYWKSAFEAFMREINKDRLKAQMDRIF